jgi:phosphatidylinositol alpha-1,6-mannosyltransferase
LPEGLVAWLCGRIAGTRTVCYAHGEELTGWGRGWKYRAMCFVLRHVDLVIANSDFTRGTLLGMGIGAARIAIVNPGVNVERFRPALACADLRTAVLGQAVGDARLLLSVGRLQRRKGFDTVIRALPALLETGQNLHYAIVGIGEDENYLRELAVAEGVSAHVHLLGHVTMEDLPRWYNACDLFLLVNRDVNGDTEGFGMVFLEANACGKAVVAGIAGGTGSAVIDGQTGLRVDGADLPAVTAAIGRLLRDEALRERLGRQGLARVEETFSWAAVARRTRHLMHTRDVV